MSLSKWFLIPSLFGWIAGLLPIDKPYLQIKKKPLHIGIRNVWNSYTIYSILLNVPSILFGLEAIRISLVACSQEDTSDGPHKVRALLFYIFRGFCIVYSLLARFYFIYKSRQLLRLCETLNTCLNSKQRSIPCLMVVLIIINTLTTTMCNMNMVEFISSAMNPVNCDSKYAFTWMPEPILAFVILLPAFGLGTVPFQLAIILLVPTLRRIEYLCSKVESKLLTPRTEVRVMNQGHKVPGTGLKADKGEVTVINIEVSTSESIVELFDSVTAIFKEYNEILSPILACGLILSLCNVINAVVSIWTLEDMPWQGILRCWISIGCDMTNLCFPEVGQWAHRKIGRCQERIHKAMINVKFSHGRKKDSYDSETLVIAERIRKMDWKIRGDHGMFPMDRSMYSFMVTFLLSYIIIMFQLS